MKSSFLKSWQTEKQNFTSDFEIDELIENFEKYRDNIDRKGFFEKILNNKYLDIIVKPKLEIEVQFVWQYITFPGFGMTAKLKGKLLREGNKTKIETEVGINPILKFMLLLFILSSTIPLINGFNWNNMLTTMFVSSLILTASMLYFKYYKDNLIEIFLLTFNLKLEND
jgi:hypothetical protein